MLLFFLFSEEGDFFSALAGGGISAMKMAGPLHPPFSLFLPEEKEKTGRARSKREKDVFHGGRGRAESASVEYACLRAAA